MKGFSMNKLLRSVSLLGLSALTLTALSGCETGEDRTLASAQSCLDGAHDEASANQCVAMVEGLQTQDAYLIRCSANFIAQGFTGDRIADAFESLSNNNGSSTDPMVTLLAYLKFDNGKVQHTSTATVDNCQKSGVRSMLRLASAAQLSTTIASLTPSGISIDPTSATAVQDMKDAIDDLIADLNGTTPPDVSALGTAAQVAAGAFCNEGSSYATNEVCTNLNAAIQTAGGPAAIGEELLNQLKNYTH
jgi:hypothetical protein